MDWFSLPHISINQVKTVKTWTQAYCDGVVGERHNILLCKTDDDTSAWYAYKLGVKNIKARFAPGRPIC